MNEHTEASLTQELRKLALVATRGPWEQHPLAPEAVHQPEFECWIPSGRDDAAYIAAANPAAILSLLDRLEKAERLLFELREAAAAVVSNEEHAFSGGMRKYVEGSQTWQVYEDLRIAMEASE